MQDLAFAQKTSKQGRVCGLPQHLDRDEAGRVLSGVGRDAVPTRPPYVGDAACSDAIEEFQTGDDRRHGTVRARIHATMGSQTQRGA